MTGLRRLVFESHIAASPERVFAFHERPDAFALLTPWWSGARVVRAAPSLRPGDRALLILGRGPLSVEWEAVHEIYEPPTCFVESQVRGPFRRWRHRHLVLPDGAGARLLTWLDRARLAQLAISLAATHWDGVRDVPDTGRSAEQELGVLGFSDQLIEAFFRPFLAGIRLRRDLSTSAAVGLFDLRMLVRGQAALPARGMQALPAALAADLPSGTIRLDTPALELMRGEGRQVRGVRTPHGELRGSAVVLAADSDATARLTGFDLPRIRLGSTTLYLAGRQRLYSQKLLMLNALPDAFVNDATLLTNVVPEYAPPGWHLLAAHVLDSDGLDDGTVEARARADLRRWFPYVDLAGWQTLAVVRTPHSQFAQPPHARTELASTRTGWPGLYLAGEITEDSSINGAIRSGEAAARIVAHDLRCVNWPPATCFWIQQRLPGATSASSS